MSTWSPATSLLFVKNLEKFRLITFDVTDTILRFRRAPAIQYAKTAAELGITNIDQERMQRCFRQEFKFMAKNYPNFGCQIPGMTWQKWWLQLVKRIFLCVEPNISQKKLDKVAETLLRIYRTRECLSHVDGARELLQKVRDAGKYIGVISNFDASLPTVLREMEIEHIFDFVLTSYDAEVQKPNTKIFKLALERCQVQANEALHIGNIYEIDYLGAKNSGWSSLLIAKDADKNINDVSAMHVYATVNELMKALETKKIEW